MYLTDTLLPLFCSVKKCHKSKYVPHSRRKLLAENEGLSPVPFECPAELDVPTLAPPPKPGFDIVKKWKMENAEQKIENEMWNKKAKINMKSRKVNKKQQTKGKYGIGTQCDLRNT